MFLRVNDGNNCPHIVPNNTRNRNRWSQQHGRQPTLADFINRQGQHLDIQDTNNLDDSIPDTNNGIYSSNEEVITHAITEQETLYTRLIEAQNKQSNPRKPRSKSKKPIIAATYTGADVPMLPTKTNHGSHIYGTQPTNKQKQGQKRARTMKRNEQKRDKKRFLQNDLEQKISQNYEESTLESLHSTKVKIQINDIQNFFTDAKSKTTIEESIPIRHEPKYRHIAPDLVKCNLPTNYVPFIPTYSNIDLNALDQHIESEVSQYHWQKTTERVKGLYGTESWWEKFLEAQRHNKDKFIGRDIKQNIKRIVRRLHKRETVVDTLTKVSLKDLLQSPQQNKRDPDSPSYEDRIAEKYLQVVGIEEDYCIQGYDGVPLVHKLHSIHNIDAEKIDEQAIRLINTAKIPPPKKSDIRHREYDGDENNQDIVRLAQGVAHYCDWNMIGHAGKDVFSRDILCSGNAYAFNEVCALLKLYTPIRETISTMIKLMDPEIWTHLIRTAQRGSDAYKNNLRHSAWDCHKGMVFLVNTRTKKHRDPRDCRSGIAGLFCAGKFHSGAICFPQLGIKIPFKPGDIILFRSFALEHFLEDWTGEHRFGSCHFTHENVIIYE
jgi:hypothetical protein